jgi:hypothetical protein
MFCLGVASHLLLDTMRANVGFVRDFEDFFNFKHSPGDIRRVPESWQHSWLFFSGIILLLCFAFSIPRFYGTHGFDWTLSTTDFSNLSSYPLILILIFGILGIVGWFVAFGIAWKLEKRPEEKQKHDYKRAKDRAYNNT